MSPKRKSDKPKAPPQAASKSVKKQILEVAGRSGAGGVSFANLLKGIGGGAGRDVVKSLVDSMVLTGDLAQLDRGRLVNPRALGWVVGRLSITRKGLGFVIPDGALDEDLMIPGRMLSTAVDGDRVAAQAVSSQRGRESGAIMAVLERTHPRIAGQYFHGTRRATVVPRSKRLARTVEVPPLPRAEARDGMWVVAEVTEWTPHPEPLVGRVAETLGDEHDRDTDLPVILAAHGVDPEFPESALREVEEIPLEIPPETIEVREDLREMTIFTIDPETAKDFDDAISIERLGPGRWRLGVHIADVAEQVREGTALDNTARWRGTSIYPVDTVIPMLPERLSNLVCSLRPDEDKCTLSAFMVIDEHGDFAEMPTMCESIIRSCRRLDYGQVQRFFDNKMSDDDRKAIEGLEEDLLATRECARALEAMRQRRGALDLDLPEVKILLDEDRRVSDIQRYPRWESHRLVESCMLAANEAVAQHLTAKRIPLIYRNHDEPNTERLTSLLPVLRSLGLKQRIPAKRPTPKDYQAIVEQTATLRVSRIIHRLLLRTLSLAVYDCENRGHFGLASHCYTHFTSPIRRYPDLMVHRILKEHLRGKGGRQGPVREAWEEELAAIAKTSSKLERRAERVDRDMAMLKTLQYLEPRVGEEMDAVISGVSSFGVWVELLEVPVEGFAHISTLGEEWYEFDEQLHVLRGEETGQIWRLGQEVRVTLTTVDFVGLELTVTLRSEPKRPAKRQRGRRRR